MTLQWLNDEQAAREDEMMRRGQERARKALELTKKRDLGDADTPAAVTLTKSAIEPLAVAIAAWVAEIDEKKGAGRRHAAHQYIKAFPPHMLAYLTIKVCIASAVRGYMLKSAAVKLSEMIVQEAAGRWLEENEPWLYQSVLKQAASRNRRGKKVGESVKHTIKAFQMDNDGEILWPNSVRVTVGLKLVELCIETCGFCTSYFTKRGHRTQIKMCFTPKIDEWYNKYQEAATLVRPMYLPTLSPPVKWAGVRDGAYSRKDIAGRFTIITKGCKGHIPMLETANLTQVFDGLNAIQETPWRINRRILQAMEDVWNSRIEGPFMPSRIDLPLPEVPQEVIDAEKGSKVRKEWRHHVRKIHEANEKARNDRFEYNRVIELALDNVTAERIYFPHRLDFRGRAYAASTSINPQGADHQRAIVEFADGMSLGERGEYWLGVHGANLFGNDKISFEDRYSWALSVIGKCHSVSADPLGDLWWTEADSPWCFLAWCFEWSAAHKHGQDPHLFVSHIPVAMDGSCNGIQHFSAMLLDPVGGKEVNLIPGDKPNDVYSRVAERTAERLREVVSEGGEKQWIAEGWLAFGIDRKITKRPVMVLPYGGTFRSCHEYVRDAVREKIQGGKENPFGDELNGAMLFLATQVWAAISDVVIAAKEAMSWLQSVARLCNSFGKPIHWTTPTGFVVLQDYRDPKSNRIATKFQGSMVWFSSNEDSNKLNTKRQVTAIAPNFVHSMDASALIRTVVRCRSEGITSFAMIHDSYGTHAANTDRLGQYLREEFVRMYSERDILADFLEEVLVQLPESARDNAPELPPKGGLDLSLVLQSKYFFA